MSNEDFVSYEIAQALKKAGFDWKCTMAYHHDMYSKHKLETMGYALTVQKLNEFTEVFVAPTLAQAQKWLREKKRWHIEVCINGCRNMFCVEIWEMKTNSGYLMLENEDGHAMLFDTYESALSAGIAAALKLIEEGDLDT